MLTYKQAEELLKSKLKNKNRIKHSISVSKVAYETALQINKKHPELKLDPEKIKIAGLLHDIGREIGEPHSIVGYKFLKSIGEEEIGKMIIGHFNSAELSNEPSMVPKTIEQKIISYSDMMVLPNGTIASFEERISGIEEKRKDHPEKIKAIEKALPRLKKLIKEIEELKK